MSASSSAVGDAAHRSPARVALTLALLLGLQPVATDLYLPALPQLTRALGAGLGAAQQTMAALLLTFGIGQLVWGPVSDRVGRRPVLLAGMVLYTLAAVGGAMAPAVDVLVAWRALQGFALAAAIVCARAIVRDLYEPLEGAKVMALGMSGIGIIGLASPVLGGVLVAAFGWRTALAAVAVCGASALAYVHWRVPESVPALRLDALRWRTMASIWRRIAAHRNFRAWTLLSAGTYCGMFTMLAASSFVYIDFFGLSPATYGLAVGSNSFFYIFGTMFCRRWVHRHGVVGAVRRGAFFTLAGGLLMALPSLFGTPSAWAIVLAQGVYAIGHGIHQPCSLSGAVAPFPDSAGAASALAGFVLATTAFAIGIWLGVAMDGSERAMTYGVAFWSVFTAAVAWTLVPRIRALA